MDRFGPILELRRQVNSGLVRNAKTSPAGSRRLSSLDQLGTPVVARPANPLAGELDHLLPKRFLESIHYDQLPHLHRYLKALLIRTERAALNPAKDQERCRQLAPYQDALNKFAPSHCARPKRSARQMRSAG